MTQLPQDNNLSAAQILETYSGDLSRDEHTRETNLIYARAFVAHARGEMSRASVIKFLDAIQLSGSDNPLARKKAVSKSTQALIFAILRRVFLSNKLEWPFRRGEAPKVQERDIKHVALAPELVRRGIVAALDGRLDSQEAAFFVLTSLYGMRKSEMGDLRPDHFNFERRTLFVSAAKRGVERYHLIPEAVAPTLEAYDWKEEMTPMKGDYIWSRIEKALSYPNVPGLGWHSIRRILVTLLWEVLPAPRITRFLRWRDGQQRQMAVRYHSVQVVGDGQADFHVDEAELEEDRGIFEVHPFLPLWRGDESWAIESAAKPGRKTKKVPSRR